MSGEGSLHAVTRAHYHAENCEWHVDQYPWECTCDALTAEQKRLPSSLRRDRTVSPGRQREREGNQVVTALQRCGTRHKPDWYCSRTYGHTGPCAAWPVSHESDALVRRAEKIAAPARQSKADSFMESLTNIAVGLAVSQVANLIVLPIVLGVPVSQRASLVLGAIYTAISLVRSYTLRRAFNGRTVWRAIRGAVA